MWKSPLFRSALALLSTAVLAIAPAASERPATGTERPPTALLAAAEDDGLPAAQRLAAARALLAETSPEDDPILAGRAHLTLGDILFGDERYAEALKALHAADRLLSGTDANWYLSRTLRRLGDTQYRLAGFDLAVASYLRSLDALRRVAAENDSRTVRLAEAHLEVVLGNTLRAVGDTVQALDDYRKAGETYRREGFSMGVAGVELSIANLLADEGRDDEAIERLQRALETARELGNPGFERLVLTNMAGCQIALGNLDSARGLLKEADELVRTAGGTGAAANVALKWGDLMAARGHSREAVRRYREAVRLARSIGDGALEAEANGLLADSLLTAGFRAAAVAPLLEQRRLLDSEASGTVASRVTSLRIAYDAERQEQALRLLEAQKTAQLRNNRALLLALGFTAILFLGTVWALRSKARLAETVAEQHRELQGSYTALERISRTDELTGLPNRRHALERLGEESARMERGGRPFCLALADLDGFKGINDRWGHAAGDAVLLAVARVLTEETRAQDFVARWGGDELLFLLPETAPDDAAAILRRALDAISDLPTPAQSGPIRVTFSAGLVSCSEGTVDSWLRAADEALYRAKARGGGSIEDGSGPDRGAPSSTGTSVPRFTD